LTTLPAGVDMHIQGQPALDDLSDVDIISPSNGDVLTYANGTWINALCSGDGNCSCNLTEIEDDISDILGYISDLQNKDIDQDAIVGNLTILVNALVIDVGDLQSWFLSLNATVAALPDWSGNITALEAAVLALQGDMSALQGTVSGLVSDVGKLQGDVSDLEQAVSDIQGDISDIQQDISDLDGRLDDAEDDIADLQDADILLSGNITGLKTSTIVCCFNGFGSEIADNLQWQLTMPYTCTAVSWTVLADQAGAIQIDVWKDSYANFPPTDADSMCSGKEIKIVATNQKGQDLDISDWTTTTINAGDTIIFNVDSCTDIESVTINLNVVRAI